MFVTRHSKAGPKSRTEWEGVGKLDVMSLHLVFYSLMPF